MVWGKKEATIDLAALPADVRKTLEEALVGRVITLKRDGDELGTLSFRSSVLEGEVLEPSRLGRPTVERPEGVTIVATAMSLSASARRKLADEFGDDFLVLDLHDAPEDTDVLLTHPISLQLLGALKSQFPQARVVITEIEDEELGVDYAGPVSRLLDAGAAAYLPPRAIAGVASAVRTYLATDTVPGITAGTSAPEPGPDRAIEE